MTGRGLLVEAFLLDFEGDLYGRELRLVFLSRLRGELKFDSIDELVGADGARRGRHAPHRRLIARNGVHHGASGGRRSG